MTSVEPPAGPLASASIILLDPTRGQKEPFGLFLLKRRTGSSFMPDRFVFPGGKVEPFDGDEPLVDQTLRTCALRELWEEAGVILASDAGAAASADEAAKNKALASLEAGHTSLGQAMAGLGLKPDLAGLRPYGRWITPKARPKRFDTFFYLAEMPQGQEAACDHKETSQGIWLGPGQALSENQAGRVELAPPQVRILGELAMHASLDDLLASVRQPNLTPVEPFLWINGKERVIMLPWDPDYEAREPVTKARPCPAHLCSRLVHDKGRWLPYGVKQVSEW
jgi:8-oxo-dGTP pyrophosphatase MutT (NUDIX family)